MAVPKWCVRTVLVASLDTVAICALVIDVQQCSTDKIF